MSVDTPRDETLHTLARELSARYGQLQELAQKLDDALGRWTRLEEHHARALADLQHSAARVQLLERRLQQFIERGPRDHFVRSGESGEVPTGVRALVDAVERVETRLESREEEVRRWLADARGDLQSAVKVLQGRTTPERESSGSVEPEPEPEPQEESHSPGPMFRPDIPAEEQGAVRPGGVFGRSAIGEPGPSAEPDRAVQSSKRDGAAVTPGGAAIGVALAGVLVGAIAIAYSVQLRGRTTAADARARSAEQRVQIVEEQSRRQLEAMRSAAEREMAAARDTAAKASAIADVLAAPDLIRFDLAGTGLAPRARGQGLWSRSRGLVFTASRVPGLPEGSVYQLWLITSGAPVSVGSAVPDSMGRITLVVDPAPTVPARVVGLVLTSESPGEHQSPSAQTYLARSS